MTNITYTVKRLLSALNRKGERLTFSSREFVGREGKIITYYSISKAEWNDERGRFDNKEIFSSASMLRILLFLRDLWYTLNKWELPMDQKKWNEIREQTKRKYGDG